MLSKLKKELEDLGDVGQARNLQRFFKTGKGEYGEGDVFLGVKVPVLRGVAKRYAGLGLEDMQCLFDSEVHEHRFVGLVLMTNRYKSDKEGVFDLYVKNAKKFNNWDLVDVSAPKIVGDYLFDKSKDLLYKFAGSDNLWERRIAIVSTLGFIRRGYFEDTLGVAEVLLDDSHDLIHKAVGWMLREVGKRDLEIEEGFLRRYYKRMPRTMLRYAIEKFDEDKRLGYLRGEI